MAPEQIRDEPVDGRADVYALGVLIYRAIAGQEPFNASKMVDLLTAHLKDAPPPIEFGPHQNGPAWAKLETVARRALKKTLHIVRRVSYELKALLRGCIFSPADDDPSILPVIPTKEIDTIALVTYIWSRIRWRSSIHRRHLVLDESRDQQSTDAHMTGTTTEMSASNDGSDSGPPPAEDKNKGGLPEDFNAERYQQLLSKVSALQKEVDLNAQRSKPSSPRHPQEASDVEDSDRSPEPSNP